ncbi:MAG TPA: hypothetical protein PLF01_03740 [Alphaproteobacteria bacterium]|nr:hypothetical protein [Alphaproteobacteria bacterium]
MSIDQASTTSQKAWVVFSGETDIGWLKILKPGFRHCFVLLHDGQRWISIDPISPCLDIQIYHHIDAEFDLPAWLESRGHKVTEAILRRHHKKPAPAMPVSCVEISKRVLGIHRRLIITPWQLYKFLKQEKSKTIEMKGELSWVS